MDINADKLGRRISVFRSSLLKILGPMLRLLASFFKALQTLDFKQLEATAFLSRKFFRLGRFISELKALQNPSRCRPPHVGVMWRPLSLLAHIIWAVYLLFDNIELFLIFAGNQLGKLKGPSSLSRILDRSFVVKTRCMLWAAHCVAVAALSAMEIRAIEIGERLQQRRFRASSSGDPADSATPSPMSPLSSPSEYTAYQQ